MSVEKERPSIVGPDSGPEAPFPLIFTGPVIQGFGRGSKDLGIPTANIPADNIPTEKLENGIYYGYASLKHIDKKEDEGTVWQMVMSVGWNPFYKNEVKSAEIHILNNFGYDFYGATMNVLVVGYIRPEYDYVSKEALIKDINTDIAVAKKSLERENYSKFEKDERLQEFAPETAIPASALV